MRKRKPSNYVQLGEDREFYRLLANAEVGMLHLGRWFTARVQEIIDRHGLKMDLMIYSYPRVVWYLKNPEETDWRGHIDGRWSPWRDYPHLLNELNSLSMVIEPGHMQLVYRNHQHIFYPCKEDDHPRTLFRSPPP